MPSNDIKIENIMPTALVDDSVVDYIKRAEINGIDPLELFVSQSLTKTSMMMSDKDAFYDVLKHFFGVYVRIKPADKAPSQVDGDVHEASEALHNLMLIALQVRNASVRAGVYGKTIKRALSATKHEGVNHKLVEALKLSRKRMEYLASICGATDNGRHALSNEMDFFPPIDEVLKSAESATVVEPIEGLEEAIKTIAHFNYNGDSDPDVKAVLDAARKYLELQQITKKD